MKVFEALDNPSLKDRPRAVCVGAFDGFHLGHQFLVSRLCALAWERHLISTVVSFEPIPAQFFAPPEAPPLRLSTKQERTALIAAACCENLVLLPFNDVLRRRTAEEFCRDILVERLNTRLLFASATHTLGTDRADLARLTELGEQLGFAVEAAPVLQCDNQWLSSTAIRELLGQGHVEEVAGLLGRHYSLEGAVVAGRGEGRRLGFPTANLEVAPEKLLPADAVYAGLARLTDNGSTYPAAISLGNAPTFDLTERLVEAFLITDEPLELVGRMLHLEFVHRLRGQEKFANVEALQKQIAADVAETVALISALGSSPEISCDTLPKDSSL
jgi:riboflavin kinase / FMN adenylyltransferase